MVISLSFSAKGRTRRRAVRYWLLMSPRIVALPPWSFWAWILIGGQPFLLGSVLAPS